MFISWNKKQFGWEGYCSTWMLSIQYQYNDMIRCDNIAALAYTKNSKYNGETNFQIKFHNI